MPELTLIDLRKELVDLKIRVNNLEKRMFRLQKEVETLLARAIVGGKITDGTHVKIVIRDDRPAIA